MRPFVLTLLLFAICSIGNAQSGTQNTMERAKSTDNKLSFVPPNGYYRDAKSPAFMNPDCASILVLYHFNQYGKTEYIEQLVKNEYFSKNNLEVKKQYTSKDPDAFGEIFECEYIRDTTPFSRLYYISGNEKETIVFMINYPRTMYTEMQPQILESIRTIKYE